jgi:hypothetical protein
MRVLRGLAAGAAAGAAGTTALNAVTYLDMALRGRPSSETPQQAAERLAERAHVAIPGEGEERGNRVAGLGPLLGVVTGTGVGALTGMMDALGLRPGQVSGTLLTAVAAMAATDGSLAALGVSDPRSWDRASWVADAIPHLAYGMVTATTLRALSR